MRMHARMSTHPHTLIPHLLAQPAPKLLSDALCDAHRGDSARLRAPNLSAACVADLSQACSMLGMEAGHTV
eukprot:133672-Chlamydomonas_euryale.AAC.4